MEAKELYTVHCGICHGAKGAGQGILVKREKILGVPSYADPGRAITPGSTYHVIYYGLFWWNIMANFGGAYRIIRDLCRAHSMAQR